MKIKRCISFFLLSLLLLSGFPVYAAAGHPQLEHDAWGSPAEPLPSYAFKDDPAFFLDDTIKYSHELDRDFRPDVTVYLSAVLQQAGQGFSFSNSTISKIAEDKNHYYLGLSSKGDKGFQAILQRDKKDITAFRLIAEGEILDFRIVHNQLWTMIKNGETIIVYVNDGHRISGDITAGSSLQLAPNTAYVWGENHLLYIKAIEDNTLYAWDGQAEAAYRADFQIESFAENQNSLYITDKKGQVFMFNGRDTLTGQDRVDPVDHSYAEIVMGQKDNTLSFDGSLACPGGQGPRRFLDSANNNWYFNLGNGQFSNMNISDGAVEVLATGISIYYDLSKEPLLCPGIKLCFNGLQVASEAEPYIRAGYVLAPVRGIAALLNAELHWENDKKISFLQQGKRMTLEIGSETAWVNDAAFTSAVAPEIKDGRVMVPLRLVSEALHFAVTWDPAEQTAHISPRIAEIMPENES